MKKATVGKLKDQLSRYLAYVERGGRVTIFKRDAPIAELVPVKRQTAGPEAVERHLEELERAGLLQRGSGEFPPELRVAPQGEESGVLHALLEERASGR